ncbi:protein-ADP-ribose hydrolase [Streptomyces sp. NPDC090306]|uniref:protein-ADP-ribose hydrolase n=1 Tax=Streptomyces sp. NPDC090306 TaxID=3365961 RepID=UPI0038289634
MYVTPTPLAAYRDLVALDVPFRPGAPAVRDPEGTVRALLADLVADGTAAAAGLTAAAIASRAPDAVIARRLLASLLTVRPARAWSPEVLARTDGLLAAEAADRPVVEPAALPLIGAAHPHSEYPAADRTALWRGNITTLGVDAVVNAANDRLLGCFVPGHHCVDNALHSAAGPRLREDCARIMALLGTSETTGSAKITRGYHLPARYVLHTVGPIVRGEPGRAEAQLLARSYLSCLDLAAEAGARTLAFCSVSTGVFGYPGAAAARIALETVATWSQAHPNGLDLVVFDVFAEADHATYTRILKDW